MLVYFLNKLLKIVSIVSGVFKQLILVILVYEVFVSYWGVLIDGSSVDESYIKIKVLLNFLYS